jgi:hypothetical protein
MIIEVKKKNENSEGRCIDLWCLTWGAASQKGNVLKKLETPP